MFVLRFGLAKRPIYAFGLVPANNYPKNHYLAHASLHNGCAKSLDVTTHPQANANLSRGAATKCTRKLGMATHLLANGRTNHPLAKARPGAPMEIRPGQGATCWPTKGVHYQADIVVTGQGPYARATMDTEYTYIYTYLLYVYCFFKASQANDMNDTMACHCYEKSSTQGTQEL